MTDAKNLQPIIQPGFFSAELYDLRIDQPLVFPVYLYFECIQQVLRWKKIGFQPDERWLNEQNQKGVKGIWIAERDRDIYRNYIAKKNTDSESISILGSNQSLFAAWSAKDLPLEPKQQSIVRESRRLLQFIREAADGPSEERAILHLVESARRIFQPLALSQTPEIRSLLDLAEVQPMLTHGLRVAGLAITLTLAFGKPTEALLGEMAIAGIVHDLGFALLPFQTNHEDRPNYRRHVELTLQIIERFGERVPHRSKVFTLQHHERADGSGFPRGRDGSDLDEYWHFLAIADTLDSIYSGIEDGRKRSFKEALQAALLYFSPSTIPPQNYLQLQHWSNGDKL